MRHAATMGLLWRRGRQISTTRRHARPPPRRTPRSSGRARTAPSTETIDTNETRLDILRLADQCVKCGLCLPHCPTYEKARHEADSPRGRIALVQGWLSGGLVLTDTLIAHLDGCLGCRACESACPSLVAFGRLMDATKAVRTAERPAWRRLLRRAWLTLLSDAGHMGQVRRLAGAYRASGAARLAELSGIARRRPWHPYHRLARVLGVGDPRRDPPLDADPQIDLFVGCTGTSAQAAATMASRALLARLGVTVRIPHENLCCGALLRHNGFPNEADRRRQRCAERHAGRMLVGLASACVAELRDDPRLRDTLELCDYLDRLDWPASLAFRPLPARVLVHEPCTHRHRLGGNAAVFRLLSRIPDLTVAPLADSPHCCGSAGTYLLDQPRMSATLLDDALAPVLAARPDFLVTTNVGCALHLAAGLAEAGIALEVCHPVELLARQLPH